jgi:hypothetical protein
VTILAKDAAAGLWLERHGVVFAAVIADDLKALWRIFGESSFLCAALRAPLRSHHVPLVVKLLVLFGEEKYLFALHARDIDIGHYFLRY